MTDTEALLDQKAVFEEIEAESQKCAAEMDRLNQAHESAREIVRAIEEAKAEIDKRLEGVKSFSLPTTPYQEELTAITAGTSQAGARLIADPIGAGTALEDLRTRAGNLVGRLRWVVELFQDAQQAGTALEQVKKQVASHRAQGLKLSEEGGNPDHFLGQGSQAHSETLMALRAGNPDTASQKLETAHSLIEQAKATIEQVQKAKAFCEREQSNREREIERLRNALPQAESYQKELQRSFAPASWQAVERNLEQARALLATFDRMGRDAAELASPETQKYLAGARQLEQLAQQQQITLRLMSGLGEQLNALSAMRAECQKRRGELDSSTRRVEGYFRQNDQVVGEMARASLDSAQRGREEVLSGFEGTRPDWPSVGRALAQALEEFAIAQSQAEADVRSFGQLRDEYDRARQELDRVARLLASRREDRVAANQHLRAAAGVLDQVGLDLSSSHGGEWARLLERVRDAVNDLEQAENLAREDIRLAAQARAEIEEATRTIRQSHGYFAMGVTIDPSPAEAALDRAAQLLEAREYEEAIRCAGGALDRIRQAHQAAVQQSSWRQMQAEADRRRWQAGNDGSSIGTSMSAGATAAAVAAGVILDRMAQDAGASAPPNRWPCPSPIPMSESAPGPRMMPARELGDRRSLGCGKSLSPSVRMRTVSEPAAYFAFRDCCGLPRNFPGDASVRDNPSAWLLIGIRLPPGRSTGAINDLGKALEGHPGPIQ